ncbi:MAG: MBL fold metallo-hydrolase [Bacillota bacterium]
MLPVHHIPLPTPYPVGPVNVYLIVSPPYTLVDAGPDTSEARAMLKDALAERGLSLTELKRVVLTHSHSDHSGLAGWLHDVSGAQVFVHPIELNRLIRPHNFFAERLAFLYEAGSPRAIVEQMLKMRDKLPMPGIPEDCAVELKGGEELFFTDGVLQVYHLPGHAPGHLCLYDPGEGNFFSGDFLLPHITPNPLVEFEPDCPGKRMHTLSIYLEGLNKVNALEIKNVWPGHGEVFTDHRKLIASYYAHHENRLEYLLAMLRKHGELTVFKLSRLVYPGLNGFDIFLGLSEIQAHLDVLEERGLIVAREHEKVFYYRALA